MNFHFIITKGICIPIGIPTLYPHIEIVFCIYFKLMISNASEERSF